jgi:hypothetical protein
MKRLRGRWNTDSIAEVVRGLSEFVTGKRMRGSGILELFAQAALALRNRH